MVTGRRQQVVSLFVASSLVLGGIAAPLSHYIWMAASGHYGHAGHAGMDHARHTSSLASETADLAECTYADLFATHVAGEPTHQAVGGPGVVNTRPGLSNCEPLNADKLLLVLTRGPPAA